MAAQILALQAIELTFGGDALLEGADLSVAPGDRVALVGRNGSGKSTLLKIAAGMVEPDGGNVFLNPGTTVRYLSQEPDLDGFDTVLAYVEAGLTEGDDPQRAQYLLDQLGLNGTENPKTLSGGEARRAALACVLAPQPDLLLLDEPTNHLDLPAIEWLESEIRSMRSALVLISHDRRFLSGLTRKTVWIDRGTTRLLNDGFGKFEAWRDKVLEEEEMAQHKLDRQIVREEHWVRYGVTARRKRNVRRMSELADLRTQKRDHKKAPGKVSLSVTQAKNSGAIVIDAEELTISFDGRPIVAGLDLRVLRGDRLGIVGPNGAGKTTLLKLMLGQIEPDSGTVKIGTNLEIASLDQKRINLDPQTTLKDALTGGGSDFVEINGQKRHFAAYMKDFLFTPDQARTQLSKLSGGERARVNLARALALPSNLMVLDEPTNDLDLETLDLLQEMVADYPGTVIVVSHDRDFLDRVATSLLVGEGNGRWVEYAGGYSDMMAQRKEALAARPAANVNQGKNGGAKLAQIAPTKKRKLSFKHSHALKTLPGKIAALEAEVVAANEKLAEPNFFTRDGAGFAALSKRLDEAGVELATAEEEWLEIEMMREELGS